MDMVSIYRKGVLFVILIIQVCHGLYLCGRDNSISYDPSTHTCSSDGIVLPISAITEHEWGTVPVRYRYCYNVKSQQLEFIDTIKFLCKNGTISQKTTPTPATTPSTTRYFKTKTSSYLGRPRHRASYACKSGRMYALPTGFDCCYDTAYKPKHHTCCSQSGIHQIFSIPERQNVCCYKDYEFSVHLRGSTGLPCQHASTNDKFFNKIRHFNPSKLRDADFDRTCKETKFAFRIMVEKRGRTREVFRLVAMLTAWSFRLHDRRATFPHFTSLYQNRPIEMPLDKYAPTENKLQQKPYLVLTNFNYFSQAVFFLKADDNLYKFPKNTDRLERMLKRLSKICRKYDRKSRRG